MMQSTPSEVTYGALPRTATCYGDGTFPTHPTRFKLLPRSVWKPTNINRHVQRVRAQLDGMCTRNAAVTLMEIERKFRNRQYNPELSAEYHYLLRNRWGAGSALDDALVDMQDPGVITMEDVGGVQIKSTREFPNNHERLASANRMLEWIDLNADFDAVATALQLHKPCLVGVNWPGGGGHAVCATELWQNGREWGIAGPNSWGKWGERMNAEIGYGRFSLTERQCRDFKTFGCWAAGSSTDGSTT